jgi:hypothetical protein
MPPGPEQAGDLFLLGGVRPAQVWPPIIGFVAEGTVFWPAAQGEVELRGGKQPAVPFHLGNGP